MPSSTLEAESRALLLRTAADAIETGLARCAATVPDPGALPQELRAERASFVTLTLEGQLRGCCGSIEPRRPLVEDVWRNARASAFRDPRFQPLEAHEWALTDVEVAVLTPLERIEASSEFELLRVLRPGEDGLVIAWRGTRATFLPKVWEQVAAPRDFLVHLKHKAGWPTDFWAADVEVWRYGTEVMSEHRPAASAPAARR